MTNFITFRYTDNQGPNGNAHEDLIRGIVANGAADGLRTKNALPFGSLVITIAKQGDQYIAAMGTADGTTNDNVGGVWPNWEAKKTVVHGVRNWTRPVEVPAEIAKVQGNQVGQDAAERIAEYILMNG